MATTLKSQRLDTQCFSHVNIMMRVCPDSCLKEAEVTHTPPTRLHASERYRRTLLCTLADLLPAPSQSEIWKYLEVKGTAESWVCALIDHFQTTLTVPASLLFKHWSQQVFICGNTWFAVWRSGCAEFLSTVTQIWFFFSCKWDNETLSLFIPCFQSHFLNWWVLLSVSARNVPPWEIMRDISLQKPLTF